MTMVNSGLKGLNSMCPGNTISSTFNFTQYLKVFNIRPFLSPARRGRGILVAPGFRQASRFLWAQKLKKITGQFF